MVNHREGLAKHIHGNVTGVSLIVWIVREDCSRMGANVLISD
jgi:hypothetical protein